MSPIRTLANLCSRFVVDEAPEISVSCNFATEHSVGEQPPSKACSFSSLSGLPLSEDEQGADGLFFVM